MKRYYRIFFTLLITYSYVCAQTPNPKISTIINTVNIDSLIENLKYITGEKPVNVFNSIQYITSRAYLNYGNINAEEYLQQRLKKYGLNTYLQTFENGGGNVIGIQQGISKPNQHIIICAHFDSAPFSGPAPGADDNGSGTSAVLEAARILSKYKTDYTIIYALWDNEEIGLRGSDYYAKLANSKKDSIVAVINMDMIGWDSNGDYLTEVHIKNVSTSDQLAATVVNVNDLYGIKLKLAYVNPGSGASDQASFWNVGYPAILLIENYTLLNGIRDFNSRYHQSNDLIQYINRTYYERCVKASIGTLATLAGIQSTTSIKENIPNTIVLNQNFPNPFNPSTVISYQLASPMTSRSGQTVNSYVSLKVYDQLGREVATLVNEEQQPGFYNFQFSILNTPAGRQGSQLSSGIYFYRLQAGNFTDTKKMILMK
jgi:hypothetical protein